MGQEGPCRGAQAGHEHEDTQRYLPSKPSRNITTRNIHVSAS